MSRLICMIFVMNLIAGRLNLFISAVAYRPVRLWVPCMVMMYIILTC